MITQSKTICLINTREESAGCRLRWLTLEEICIYYKYEHLSSKRLELPTILGRIKKEPNTPRALKNIIKALKNAAQLLLNRRINSVVTGKPSSRAILLLLLACKTFRKTVIVDICDLDWSKKYTLSAIKIADIVTTPTEYLADEIKHIRKKPLVVISDKLDYACLPSHKNVSTNEPIDLLWFGNLEKEGAIRRESFAIFCKIIKNSRAFLIKNNISITIISPRAQDSLEMLLRAIGNTSIHCESLKWSPITMQSALAKKGFALLPYKEPIESCTKSPNRIELALYSGRTVLSNGILPSLDTELQKYITICSDNRIDETALKALKKSKNTLEETRALIEKKQTKIKEKWQAVADTISFQRNS